MAAEMPVRNRFRTLALKYHPSRDPSDNASTEFARVCEAYDVLSKRKFPIDACIAEFSQGCCP